MKNGIVSDLRTIPIPTGAWPNLVRTSSTRIMHHNASLPEDLVEALWEQPERILDSGTVMRKTHLKSAVKIEYGSRSYVMKHYFERSLAFALKKTLRGTQARNAFELGCTLADAGIKTPRPMAYVDNIREGLRRDCFLLYPFVEGLSLRSAINEGHMDDADVARAIDQVEELWNRLIELRVALYDANAGNFVVSPKGELWLIDLDDSRIRSALFARAHLLNKWFQVHRSMRRAVRTRDKQFEVVKRAA